MLEVLGAEALSPFRITKLLDGLRGADASIEALSARFIHFVDVERPLTEQERAVFQSVIDSMYGRFVALIVKSRKLTEEKVKSAADGRIYTAEQAKDLGLVSEIGYMDDAVTAARKAAGLSEARVIMYRRPREFRANFYSAAPMPAPGMEASLQQLTAVVSGSGPRFLYLWWP